MAHPDITLQVVHHDVHDLRRQLATLHRTLDATTYWPSRLRLRAEIAALPHDLVLALHRRRDRVTRRLP